MTPERRALLGSFGRVFAAAAFARALGLDHGLTHISVEDVRVVTDAGLAAVLLTAVNYLRPGETRFGRTPDPAPDSADPVATPQPPVDSEP